MFSWKYGFNLKLDAAKEGAEGGGSGGGDANGNSAENKDKAGSEGSESGDQGEEGQLEVDKLPPAAQKLIKDLRSENAKIRTKSKESLSKSEKLKAALVEAGLIENDEEAPEEKIKGLTTVNQGLQFRSAVLEAAVEHSVPKGQLDYFEFLLAKAAESLEDGQELPGEEIVKIAKKARSAAGLKTNSSVGGGQGDSEGNEAPPPGGEGGITLEQFTSMNMGEKSALFQKSPDVYNALMAEARKKKLLVR